MSIKETARELCALSGPSGFEEAAALSDAAASFSFTGDCAGVKNIMNATKTGWQAGLNIGR